MEGPAVRLGLALIHLPKSSCEKHFGVQGTTFTAAKKSLPERQPVVCDRWDLQAVTKVHALTLYLLLPLQWLTRSFPIHP